MIFLVISLSFKYFCSVVLHENLCAPRGKKVNPNGYTNVIF